MAQDDDRPEIEQLQAEVARLRQQLSRTETDAEASDSTTRALRQSIARLQKRLSEDHDQPET